MGEHIFRIRIKQNKIIIYEEREPKPNKSRIPILIKIDSPKRIQPITW